MYYSALSDRFAPLPLDCEPFEGSGGDPIPDNPDECWYWTSTEVQNQDLVKAWLYSLSSGALQETPKNASHKARAIISLNQ